jgi:acyl carrier protein phosphodiesterase
VFGSVVVVVFQIVFCAEIHASDFFYFLKIIFNISISKRSKKYKPHLILKFFLKFNEMQIKTHSQTSPSTSVPIHAFFWAPQSIYDY